MSVSEPVKQDDEAVARTFKLLEDIANGAHTANANADHHQSPETLPAQTRLVFPLSIPEYEALLSRFRQDKALEYWRRNKLRYSWTEQGRSGRLVVRMPCPAHCGTALEVEDAIWTCIKNIRKGRGAQMVSSTDARLLGNISRVGTSDSKRGRQEASADGGFRQKGNIRALVRIEVGYSQDREELHKLPKKWLEFGANLTILVDIPSKTPTQRKSSSPDTSSSTYSVYRTVRSFDDAGHPRKAALMVEKEVKFELDPDGFLKLHLSDFCLPSNRPTVDLNIHIPHHNLIQALHNAFEEQAVFDLGKGYSSDAEIENDIKAAKSS